MPIKEEHRCTYAVTTLQHRPTGPPFVLNGPGRTLLVAKSGAADLSGCFALCGVSNCLAVVWFDMGSVRLARMSVSTDTKQLPLRLAAGSALPTHCTKPSACSV